LSIVYLGIDDTDIPGSPGTGRVARGLAKHLEKHGLAQSLGVSRHQLLVDPHIRYTSHNSAKGIAINIEATTAQLLDASLEYMAGCYQTGADPGLCICPESQVDDEIIEYGRLAVSSIITKQAAADLAQKKGIILKELGGTGDGIIGALAAVGLRAGGNDGRLVDLRGIHDIKGTITADYIKKNTDIDRVENVDGFILEDAELIDSLDRIRPNLRSGKPVLRVERDIATGHWIPVEHKLKHSHEEMK